MNIQTSGWSAYAAAAYGAITARIAPTAPPHGLSQDPLSPRPLAAPSGTEGRFVQALGSQAPVQGTRHVAAASAVAETSDWSAEAATRTAVMPSQQALVEATDLLHGSELTQASAMFAVQVNQAIRTYGIAVPPEPVIGLGRDGALQVLNAHPQAARLEGVLRSQEGLSERFAQLAASLSAQRQITAQGTQLDPLQRVNTATGQQAMAPMYMRISADGIEPFFGMARSVHA